MKIPSPDSTPLRSDQKLVASLIPSGVRVLDIGCGTGNLLHYLVHTKDIDGRGMEISQDGVNACVAKGLSVVQGDADTDLTDYPDAAFDYVILSQTLQATFAPHDVLKQMLRIGKHCIVSIPNFGYWRVRLNLLLHGRMPVTPHLPHAWYDTPNIHFCTLRDFMELTQVCSAHIVTVLPLHIDGVPLPCWQKRWSNHLAAQGVFVLRKT
ncbi:MAG: methionine biosynthesis protein MetW [Holosporales bacterium]|jgi:methionine biosynthesis protein MetW